MLMMLITAVNVTDKATSPFANFVKTFDVIPPGAAAIIRSDVYLRIESFDLRWTTLQKQEDD